MKKIFFWTACIFMTCTLSAASQDMIPLNEYIKFLKSEFTKLTSSKEDGIPFYIGTVNVELNAVFKKSVDGNVEFYVFEVGGGAENQFTQKLSFPISFGPENEKLKASNENFIDDDIDNIFANNLKFRDPTNLVSIANFLASETSGLKGQWAYVGPNAPIPDVNGISLAKESGFVFSPESNNISEFRYIPSSEMNKLISGFSKSSDPDR